MTIQIQSLPWPDLRGGSRSGVSAHGGGALITVSAAGLAVLLFGVAAFEHRWISDDGMIVVREVRQILAGAGPNYNVFQRDEVDTSPLWTWLLAAFAFVRRGDIAVDAVELGLVLAVAGLACGLSGSLKLHRQLGASGVLLPVGALVPVAISGFWCFATSGLETGLSLFWLSSVWCLLVSLTEEAGRARLVTLAVMTGAGPLVRPEFALVTGVFGIALLLIVRPGWRRGLAYAGIAAVLPVGYEVFRMGYYGLIVPMPALAKEAGNSRWAHGFTYLADFVDAYVIWVPLLLIAIVGARLVRKTGIDRRSAVLLTAPSLSGILLSLYVVKVGGDYMHARMWIPVTFALVLPMMMAPVGRNHRVESVGAALIAVWALAAGLYMRPPSSQSPESSKGGIVDEHDYETIAYAGLDVSTTGSRTRRFKFVPKLADLIGSGDRVLVLQSRWALDATLRAIPMSPSVPDNSGWFSDNMGIAAAVMPLNDTVIDVNGLASPLAGHLLQHQRDRPGHEKWLPTAWVLAEYADSAAISTMTDIHDVTDARAVTKGQLLAARHALSCGRIKELMDSVNEPMSMRRFWDNLSGSLTRSGLRIPADPFDAERQFCRQ
jgi:arabinofuranosyltransferase